MRRFATHRVDTRSGSILVGTRLIQVKQDPNSSDCVLVKVRLPDASLPIWLSVTKQEYKKAGFVAAKGETNGDDPPRD